MKNNKKRLRNLGGLSAMVGFLICLLNFEISTGSPGGCILWAAEAFAVSLLMGYLGFELELWLNRKKFKVIGKKSIIFGIISSLVLGAVIGAAGQAVYSLEIQEYEIEKEVDTKSVKTNVALMVDYSSSMDFVLPDYLEAANELIDNLSDQTSLQFAAFSDLMIDNTAHATQMLPMTKQNKTVIKDFIENMTYSVSYGTNFDIPLNFAVDSLTNSYTDGTRSVIVILTDCEGIANDLAIKRCKDNNCELYVLTLNTGPSSINQLEKAADKYFRLETNSDGSINVSDAIDALEAAISGTTIVKDTEKRLAISEKIIGLDDMNILRAIVTMLFFGLLTTAAGFIYYGFESIRNLLINFAFGAASGLLTAIYPPGGVVLLLAAGLGNYNKYTVTEETTDV